MKTIFISIPIGIIARNILQTDVFRILKAQKDLRIVLILPPNVDPHFRKEVESENVIIEEWRGRVRAGILRHFILYPFMRNLVYTQTSKFISLYGSKLDRPKYTPFRYFFKLLFFPPLSKITFLKRFCSWLNDNFFAAYDRVYEPLFNQYKPDLVFATNLFHGPVCMALIRIARRRGIPTIGMVKSWDNLDKSLLITLSDTFLVWNEKMREDLIKLQDVKPEKIIITGIPQFDFYKNPKTFLSREEYCRQMGINPAKKILFFGSEGSTFPYDDEIVDILHQFIVEGAFKEDCVLLVRPHFRESKLKKGRFERFKNYPHLVLDKPDRTSGCFYEQWYPSFENMVHLANNLYHCDVVIVSFSTLSLDAVAFDKPIINVAFDGLRKRSKVESAMRVYKYTHYQQVVRTGGVKLVYNKEELKDAINQYLENPSLDSEGRERLRQRFCYKLDGKSSQRIAQCLLVKLDKEEKKFQFKGKVLTDITDII